MITERCISEVRQCTDGGAYGSVSSGRKGAGEIKLNQDEAVESAEVTQREGSCIAVLSEAGTLTNTGIFHF